MISFLCFKPPPRNRRIRFPVFTPRGSAPVALRPQKLELPLRLVDPMIAYAVYNYHQFFPAQFICPYRIVGDSWPPFSPFAFIEISCYLWSDVSKVGLESATNIKGSGSGSPLHCRFDSGKGDHNYYCQYYDQPNYYGCRPFIILLFHNFFSVFSSSSRRASAKSIA